MVNEKYLVLNRHGTSIMKTFIQKKRGLIKCQDTFLFTKLTIQNTDLGLTLEKSLKLLKLFEL